MDRPVLTSGGTCRTGTWARRLVEVRAMAGSDAKTTVLIKLLERMKGGDRQARDELIRASMTASNTSPGRCCGNTRVSGVG